MKRLLFLLLLAVPCLAQNLRFDAVVQGVRGPVPGATVAVCTQPANTVTTPCTPLASLCSSLTDVTCTSPNPLTADGLGNYHFYAQLKNGPYTVQIYGPQIAVPYILTDQLPAGVLTGNNLFTGNLTLGLTSGAPNSTPSPQLQFQSKDSGGNLLLGTVNSDVSGNLIISPQGTGGGVGTVQANAFIVPSTGLELGCNNGPLNAGGGVGDCVFVGSVAASGPSLNSQNVSFRSVNGSTQGLKESIFGDTTGDLVLKPSVATTNGTVLSNAGYGCLNTTAKTLAYTLLNTDCVIQVSAAGGSFTLTLPHAVKDSFWYITRTDTTPANTVILAPDSGTLNGLSTLNIAPQVTLMVTCDGVNCWTLPQTYTPLNSLGLTANLGATQLLTPPASGVYRVSCYVVLTTAATTSSTLPSCNVAYTDADTSVAEASFAITSTVGTNTVGNFASGNTHVNAKVGTQIQISTAGYVSTGATAMQYAVHARVEGPL